MISESHMTSMITWEILPHACDVEMLVDDVNMGEHGTKTVLRKVANVSMWRLREEG